MICFYHGLSFKLQADINAIQQWLYCNYIKLNVGLTEMTDFRAITFSGTYCGFFPFIRSHPTCSGMSILKTNVQLLEKLLGYCTDAVVNMLAHKKALWQLYISTVRVRLEYTAPI